MYNNQASKHRERKVENVSNLAYFTLQNKFWVSQVSFITVKESLTVIPTKSILPSTGIKQTLGPVH